MGDAADLGIFRLREFAYRCRGEGRFDPGVFDTDDPLGWYRDSTVELLLTAAFAHGAYTERGLVLLENLPGNADQLQMIVKIAALSESAVGVIELVADDLTVETRSRQRRVCPTCEADPQGDPHRPAVGSETSPGHCRRCHTRLIPRRSDDPAILSARLRRYRDRIPGIRACAKDEGLPYRRVDATRGADACSEAVVAAVRSLGTPVGVTKSPSV
ncbi:hypothetical protein D0Q02_26790 [Micromonospora craniellae]|uniref:Adenylate kinase n=1 Tax=Micromonospora craniellae TaxID=2294034 RepID=A0A372FS84_9ACTN|nr:hypothetical protein D0Q02_26790 [Micromonospora craniellae]